MATIFVFWNISHFFPKGKLCSFQLLFFFFLIDLDALVEEFLLYWDSYKLHINHMNNCFEQGRNPTDFSQAIAIIRCL